jgi:protein TonB
MFANFATAIPTGAAVTFMLLFAMQSLIARQPGLVMDTTPRYDVTFVRVIPPENVIVDDFLPIDIPDPMPSPPLPSETDYSPDGAGFTLSGGPEIPSVPDGTLNNPFTSNGRLIAIVRVQPHYPAVAQSRGLEGFVIVQFDVLSNGTVANVSVLKSSSSVFERSAINAAERFRFKAEVVDGEPLTSTGVQYQFTFKMDN